MSDHLFKVGSSVGALKCLVDICTMSKRICLSVIGHLMARMSLQAVEISRLMFSFGILKPEKSSINCLVTVQQLTRSIFIPLSQLWGVAAMTSAFTLESWQKTLCSAKFNFHSLWYLMRKGSTCGSLSPLPLSEASTNVGPVVLVMTIEIGEGKTDDIVIHQLDDLLSLVDAFVIRNNLANDVASQLLPIVQENVQSAVNMLGTTFDAKAKRGNVIPRVASLAHSHSSRAVMHTHQPTINLNSRELTKHNKDESVFARLHSQGLAQQRKKQAEAERKVKEEEEKRRREAQTPLISDATRELTRHRGQSLGNAKCPNYGAMLYSEAVQKRELQTKEIRELKERQEQEEMRNAPFHPEITPFAKKMFTGPHGKRCIELTAKPPASLADESDQDCTFRPQVDPKSQQIAKLRVTNVPHHEALFLDAEKRRWRQEDKLRQIVAEQERSKFVPSAFHAEAVRPPSPARRPSPSRTGSPSRNTTVNTTPSTNTTQCETNATAEVPDATRVVPNDSATLLSMLEERALSLETVPPPALSDGPVARPTAFPGPLFTYQYDARSSLVNKLYSSKRDRVLLSPAPPDVERSPYRPVIMGK
eukprot:TRINITY_DN7647_c0_g1_i1.p1 TRINITY_DN7647_c0_g1~~TRINITY_DN7647_c0_g1_i1.p1  ORF type:complete len:590 (-),score=89.49 TRINITY_DN7647_c0_g1_i1:265-2034(-)